MPSLDVNSMVCGLLLLAACSGSPVDSEADPARRSAPASAAQAQYAVAPDPAARMYDHFEESIKIKDAIIAGDLAGVRTPARGLAERIGPYPESWRPFMSTSRRFARDAGAARDLRAAAQAAAGLANTCGDCHDALDAEVRLPGVEPLPRARRRDARKHMSQHQWAADRLWEALVTHSDAAWSTGAKALDGAPLNMKVLTADVKLPDDVIRLGDRVHALGAVARKTADWPTRASLYGQLLATCAVCHQAGHLTTSSRSPR